MSGALTPVSSRVEAAFRLVTVTAEARFLLSRLDERCHRELLWSSQEWGLYPFGEAKWRWIANPQVSPQVNTRLPMRKSYVSSGGALSNKPPRSLMSLGRILANLD